MTKLISYNPSLFFQMRKLDHIYKDSEEIYHDYSRSQIKEQIEQLPHESFDVSSFNQSRAPVEGPIRNNFPISNAPTLEISPDKNIGSLTKQSFYEKKDPSDLTARNQTEKQKNKITVLEKHIQELEREMAVRESEFMETEDHIRQLNTINLNLEKKIRDKDLIITQKQNQVLLHQQEIGELKKSIQSKAKLDKKDFSTRKIQSSFDSSSYSDSFCPQFLSPDESVQLFYQLLEKIDSSTKMKKKLRMDSKVCQVLQKILHGG